MPQTIFETASMICESLLECRPGNFHRKVVADRVDNCGGQRECFAVEAALPEEPLKSRANHKRQLRSLYGFIGHVLRFCLAIAQATPQKVSHAAIRPAWHVT